MFHLSVAACAVALVWPALAHTAQVSTPAAPRVGSPTVSTPQGPPAPLPAAGDLPLLTPRTGPLPADLTLARALEEAEARSPAVIAARLGVQAAEGRIRQAGFRANPELNVEFENFLGTGDLSGLQRLETTVSVSQRLDLGGRRRARVAAARADLATQQLRVSIARADLAQAVRRQFAEAATARERLRVAEQNEAQAREVARVAGLLVDAGREPPLRALRARSGASQAAAELAGAQAQERGARASFAELFGAGTAIPSLSGGLLDLTPRTIEPEQSLEARLADAERLAAEAALAQELAARSLDPAVGVGVRHVRELGDFALVAGASLPLPVFDRNQGGIAAARANVEAAMARRGAVVATTRARIATAMAAVEAAGARVRALDGAAIPEAAEALRLTDLSYRAGKSPLVELLDAQAALASAQTALIDARLAQALATAELGRASAR